MENYIIREFMDSKSDKKSKRETRSKSIDSRRRATVIELFEQSNGFIGPEEIANLLDIDLAKVERYLGKRRIQRYERLKLGEDIQESEKENKGKSRVTRVSGVSPEQSERLTPNRVKKITDERNSRIIAMHEQGLSIDDIASKERLTPDQAREIFLSLGLSIYTQQELLEMKSKAEKARKNREEAERLERKRSRQSRWIREKRARIKAEKQRQEERKREEETGVFLVRDFEDLKRAIRILLKQGKSKRAIELGEYFLRKDDVLSSEEKSKLFLSIEELKDIKKAYQRRERRETQAQKNGEER